MNQNKNQLIDIQALADNLVQDIAALREAVSAGKVPQDLEHPDLSSFVPRKTVETVRQSIGQVREMANTALRQHQDQLRERDQALAQSIKLRQDAMRGKLEKMKRTKEDDAAMGTIKLNMEADLKRYERYASEPEIKKATDLKMFKLDNRSKA